MPQRVGGPGLRPSTPALEPEAAFAGFTNRFRLYRREVYDAELAEDEDDDIDPLTLVGRHKRTG